VRNMNAEAMFWQSFSLTLHSAMNGGRTTFPTSLACCDIVDNSGGRQKILVCSKVLEYKTIRAGNLKACTLDIIHGPSDHCHGQ
jgi:hypothetical protein